MEISVIIPTYNRRRDLQRTLNGLAKQTLPAEQFEVIVVDDGSTDGTPEIGAASFPFRLVFLSQPNKGATLARNNGFGRSQGELLVFLDDDIFIAPSTLAELLEQSKANGRSLIMGTLVKANHAAGFIEQRRQKQAIRPLPAGRFVPFVSCKTGLLAVRRAEFLTLSMFQDPTCGRGWPNWDDVDFGYRAHCQQIPLFQSYDAVGEHWDYTTTDFNVAMKRWQRAGKSAVLLFQRHPELKDHLTMFEDKMAVRWRADSVELIGRKVIRRCLAWPPALSLLERGLLLLRRYYRRAGLKRTLVSWIAGGYMLRGYRAGRKEYRS